ncbi:hypothetical protein BT96DRAFT_920629, partial [Gymnopus androsaceus JB14]
YNLFQVKSLVKFIIIYFIFFGINFSRFIIDPVEWVMLNVKKITCQSCQI